jgi:hypothetical protein
LRQTQSFSAGSRENEMTLDNTLASLTANAAPNDSLELREGSKQLENL